MHAGNRRAMSIKVLINHHCPMTECVGVLHEFLKNPFLRGGMLSRTLTVPHIIRSLLNNELETMTSC